MKIVVGICLHVVVSEASVCGHPQGTKKVPTTEAGCLRKCVNTGFLLSF